MTSAHDRRAVREAAPGRLFRHRFLVLLASLFLMFLTVPLLRPVEEGAFPELLVSGLFAVILLSGVYAVSGSRATVRLALALAVATIALQASNVQVQSEALAAAAHLVAVLLLGFTSVILVRFLFLTHRVTLDVIAASLCVYLILGLMWALLYSLIEWLQPGSFALGGSVPSARTLRFGAHDSVVALYYSLVTLTTLGYGDIAPVSPASRMLAATEAVLGQFFITVLVARLVGLHISQVRPASEEK